MERIVMTQSDTGRLERIHVRVTGRVQGVGFRAFVLEAAEQAGISGWVRNMGYDQVESIAEGPHQKLEWFAMQLKAGPLGGRVDEANVDWEPASGEFTGFTVRSSR
jgi:acylphosphatase